MIMRNICASDGPLALMNGILNIIVPKEDVAIYENFDLIMKIAVRVDPSGLFSRLLESSRKIKNCVGDFNSRLLLVVYGHMIYDKKGFECPFRLNLQDAINDVFTDRSWRSFIKKI